MLKQSGNTWAANLRGGVSRIAMAVALSAGTLGIAHAQGDGAAPAPAPQPAAEDQGGLDIITVTAEFRASNLQKTPLAITAVNAAMLEARSQTNVAQITAQAPNVSLRPAGSAFGNSLVAFIRGVGQTDFNYSTEPGVGVYVDDVYYATITGNVLDLLDLNRVEISRGPQGTLSGRNAIGGAIKLYTRQPDGSDDGFVEATYGKFDRADFRGAAGFTIVPDKLFARVAGASRTRDGYVDRIDYACANPGSGLPTYAPSFGCKLGTEGGQSYTSGRLALRWVVSDDFEINVAGDITNDDSESQPGVLVAALDHSGSSFPWYSPNGPGFGADPFTCIAAGVVEPWADCALNNPSFNGAASQVPIYYDNPALCGAAGIFDVACDVPFDSRFVTGGTYYNYATYIDDGKSTPDPLFQGGTPGADSNVYKPYVVPPINTFKSYGGSVNVDWRLAENLSLLSVSSYRYYTNSFAEDTDGSPLAVQQLLQRLVHRQWSQELRLNGSLYDGLFDYTFGGFYMDQSGAEDARVDLPYVGFDFIHGPDQTPSKNKALYAHVTVNPYEDLSISVGGRFSHDEKSYTFRRRNPDLTPVLACTTFWFWEAGNPANCGVFGLDNLSTTYSSERWDYRVAVNYDVTDDVMVYGQIATGYKGGGNNARPFFPAQLNVFQPETLTSYEGGFKSTWFDQLRLNAAGFWNVYKSIQLPVTVCSWAPPGLQTPCASSANVGDAHVWGVEFEAEWHPTDAVTIDGSYSYLNFEYQRVDPTAAVTIDMVTPYTPDTKWSVGAQYEIGMGDLGSLTPRVDVSYQADVFASAVNRPTNLIDSYTLANARLTWKDVDSMWQASLEVTNVTDEYYYVTLFDLSGEAAGYVHGQPSRPREWAVTLKRKF